ncbi:hypothetical protein ACRRHK_000883 [Vibrio fluvialis]
MVNKILLSIVVVWILFMAMLDRFPNDYNLIANVAAALVAAASLSWTTFVYVDAERKKKSADALEIYIRIIDKLCSQLSNHDIETYQKFEYIRTTYNAIKKVTPLIADTEHQLHSEIKYNELKVSLTEFYYSLKASDLLFIENEVLNEYFMGRVANSFTASAYWLTVLWLRYVIPSPSVKSNNNQYIYGWGCSLHTETLLKVISLFISNSKEIIEVEKLSHSIRALTKEKLIPYDGLIAHSLDICPALLAHVVLKDTLGCFITNEETPRLYEPQLDVLGPEGTWLAMEKGMAIWTVDIPKNLQQSRYLRPKENCSHFAKKYMARMGY